MNKFQRIFVYVRFKISEFQIQNKCEQMKKIRLYIAFSLVLLEPNVAFAYLDPGTGSMLLSIVVGTVSSAYFFIRKLPSLIRATFFRFSGNKEDLQNNSIVFYAESKSYWSTFKPVLEALAQKK